MVRCHFIATAVLLCVATSFVQAQKNNKETELPRREVKFLEDIEVPVEGSMVETGSKEKMTTGGSSVMSKKPVLLAAGSAIETASVLQFKYALLLDTEVESVINLSLFQLIDDWLGTRYRLGGNNKNGIDCSAFMQVMYTGIFGIALPRTAREQYLNTKRISRTELKEGDLLFFNTRGGVSHVGMYLQNNKFVHASSSGGVMISDLYDSYWVKRFIGVGRHSDRLIVPAFFSNP
jgi:lipoprotein Spr